VFVCIICLCVYVCIHVYMVMTMRTHTHTHVHTKGAGQDIGRSCILVSVGSKTIMFDCGMHMGYNDHRRFPNFSYISETKRFNQCIDCVIISHLYVCCIDCVCWLCVCVLIVCVCVSEISALIV